MAIIESVGGSAMAVDPGFSAARVSVRPPETTSWISVGATTGALANVSTGSTGLLFSIRNLGANPLMLRRIGMGFVTTTAFTAAQMVGFGLSVARNWTVSDTGGTAIILTGNNGKHRSSMANLTSVDCRLATTATLGNGTKTGDANTIAQVAGWAAGQGVAVVPGANNLFGHDPEDYPLILAQNEGFNILNMVPLGAGGLGTAIVNFEIAEAVVF